MIMLRRMYDEFTSSDGHTRRFTVARHHETHGWEVRHEEDNRLITSVVYHDWHRVERARHAFAAEAHAVRTRGGVGSEPV